MPINPSFMDHQRLQSRLQDLPSTKRWIIGTAIFRDPESENPTILLLQRAGNETFPNPWELPSDPLDEADASIAHAVKREVLEKTSLSVARFIGEMEPLTWESKSNPNIQLNYIVTVQPGGSVKTNPDEHSDWVWARLEELDYFYITPAIKSVIQDAFIFVADMD